MDTPFAFLDVVGWWLDLTAAQKLFYGIGIVAGVVTLVMAALALIGMSHHDVSDVVDVSDGGSLISTKPLTGFFLGFGWAGGVSLDNGGSLLAATGVGIGVGLAVMFLVAAMIRGIYSLRSDGTQKIEDAVGKIGTVYVTLPPSRAAGGQIAVTVSGRQETIEALNAANRAIPSGDKVKVVAVVDGRTVLVEPLA